MKKAYVKPVFLAEEFVAASSYAASPCGVSERKPYELEIGDQLCPDGDSGHYVGGQHGDKGTINENWHYDNSYTNWQYATKVDNKATIFMDKACDFFWDPDTGSDGNVYVWDNVDEQLRNNKYTGDEKKWHFFGFLSGTQASHVIAFEGTKIPQS